ncbi:MAG TPA: nucleotidyltransferase domain-containing protein [Micromonosporaceae bacterium]|nr:nucleotidyltransferase domain-containing protein [Micromonosporaceae bacterium]
MILSGDVANVVARVVALYDPDEIWVFGSYAKGNLAERSDLDLIVIKPTSLPRRLRGRDVVAVLAEAAFHIDLLFVTPEELATDLKEPYSLLSTVMPTAQRIYRREVGGAVGSREGTGHG